MAMVLQFGMWYIFSLNMLCTSDSPSFSPRASYDSAIQICMHLIKLEAANRPERGYRLQDT